MLNFINRIWSGRSPAYAVIQTLGTQVFVILINVATGVVTARVLGPEGRGVFTAVTTWPGFFSFLSFGVPTAMVYFLRNAAPNEKQPIISAGLLLTALLGFIVTLGGMITIPFLLSQFSYNVIIMAEFCTIWTVFSLCTATVKQILASDKKFQLLNVSNWLSPLLYLAGLILIALSGSLTVWHTIIALSAPGPIVFLWLSFKLRSELRITTIGIKTWGKKIVLFGLQTAPLDLVSNMLSYVDRFFLVGLISAESLGVYAVVYALSRLVTVLSIVINSIVYPSMSGRPLQEMKDLHDHAFRFVAYVVISAAFVVSVIGTNLISLVYGSAYSHTGNLLEILVVEAGIGCLGQVVIQLYLACGKPAFASITQAISLVVACAALAALTPLAGSTGAAWALLIATTSRVVILLAGIPLRLSLSLPRFYPKVNDLHYVIERLR